MIIIKFIDCVRELFSNFRFVRAGSTLIVRRMAQKRANRQGVIRVNLRDGVNRDRRYHCHCVRIESNRAQVAVVSTIEATVSAQLQKAERKDENKQRNIKHLSVGATVCCDIVE